MITDRRPFQAVVFFAGCARIQLARMGNGRGRRVRSAQWLPENGFSLESFCVTRPYPLHERFIGLLGAQPAAQQRVAADAKGAHRHPGPLRRSARRVVLEMIYCLRCTGARCERHLHNGPSFRRISTAVAGAGASSERNVGRLLLGFTKRNCDDAAH